MIRDNLRRLKDHISSICKDIGRNPNEITLIGVTKFAEASQIQEALDAGLSHIAENKVQEAQRKFPLLRKGPYTKHMIGHLQSNKAKAALNLFDLIQSVDSLKLAQELDKQAKDLNKRADVLIEVLTSGEEQKFGVAPEKLAELLAGVTVLKHIKVLGLMTMAAHTEDQVIIGTCFATLRSQFERIKKNYKDNANIEMKYLSMGMSSDYEIALKEGANMLRIGSAIFKNG